MISDNELIERIKNSKNGQDFMDLFFNGDLSKNKGERVSNLKVRNAQGLYETLNPNQTYQVITINFLADGQDFYDSFKQITGERRVEVGLDYAEAFLQYAKSTQGLKRLPTEFYSTQNYKE